MAEAHYPLPPDSATKRAVRQELYRRATRAWDLSGHPGGWAITLAGWEAREVPLLRDQYRWDPTKTLFVDTDPRGLEIVKKSWPEAQIRRGQLAWALRDADFIGFLNLDFMGMLNEDVQKTIRLARGKLLPGAVVSFTFSTQMAENNTHYSWRSVSETASKFLSPTQMKDKELVRWVGNVVCLQQLLGLPKAHLLGLLSYTGARLPMRVVILHNTPPESLSEEPWKQALREEALATPLYQEMR